MNIPIQRESVVKKPFWFLKAEGGWRPQVPYFKDLLKAIWRLVSKTIRSFKTPRRAQKFNRAPGVPRARAGPPSGPPPFERATSRARRLSVAPPFDRTSPRTRPHLECAASRARRLSSAPHLSPQHEELRLSQRPQEAARPLGGSQRSSATAGAFRTSKSVPTPRRRAVSSSCSSSTCARARAALMRPLGPHPPVRPHTHKNTCAACTHITNFTALASQGNAHTPTVPALSELTGLFVVGTLFKEFLEAVLLFRTTVPSLLFQRSFGDSFGLQVS